MQEAGDAAASGAATRALDWLQTEQVLDEPGDWQVNRPGWREADGRSSSRTLTTPISTTRRCGLGMHQAHNSDEYTRACAGPSIGWSECKARTADSPPSTPTTPITR